MNYQLIRSKRKTLSLQVNNQAELIVRAPNLLPIEKIEQFVVEKSSWIDKKLTAATTKIPKKPYYQNNENFLYLGNSYPLMISSKFSAKLNFNGVKFKTKQANRAQFLTWYKNSFREIALPRLMYYAKTHKLNYQQVRLKSQKTLWGSCSSVNNINLNYLLIQAPINVIDYVIVHELCHTVHKNHSKDFWQLVESILPNYKASKSWLKSKGYKLHQMQ